jgi:tellurite resistance protein TerC
LCIVTVSPLAWAATIVGILVVLAVDLLIIGRRPHAPSMRESTLWVCFYVTLAVLFGVAVLLVAGSTAGGEFFAGYLTEYSLSIDNLFIFVIIMSRFAVPAEYQQKVLLVGILLALLMRGIFIALGAAAISAFSWVFYLFGAFLVYTAWKLARHNEGDEEFRENAVLRMVGRVLPTTDEYHGSALTTRLDGRRLVTPMLVVMIAIGTTDLLFALDSIPAIFGLTKEPYLVFTANAFALMGLRQLYFLLGGLLNRLVYLSYGLAVILAFIGVKLVLEALHENSLPFINGGEHVEGVPEIPIWLSLGVIVVTLAITTVLSLAKSARDRRAEEQERPELGAGRRTGG